ncbi:methylthioribulose-1-phosphate dehydratase [Fischerella major NIES-592]|uniref:Methylthioribulose-1-phosphate dehydratase n=2 Tax=Fischerella TaxID=1190 RepID=A0A1U7GY26_9CYAN|nr:MULTISPECIES: methylthioribulose 1-phosphate dehydratase [Fischerella]OKH13263.1 methylthioribulose-1-phosphate dehydratase [Fischerella major NIES-592]PMB44326.1 methylthioribulose 1-phosphate dehydratase [Fischerella thermalis CCMEE 5330]BAU07116.1 putative aldolase [Fischerella sp. NIES-3754]BCX09437.1 MAG: methylthioribulose-1-phosphate dehydratase [Fischerella sp.]
MNISTLTDVRLELIAAARYFYQQGWMVGTAGNLSIRLSDGSFWITASGKSKGELVIDDFVRVYPDGRVEQPTEDSKPSAETAIHQVIYNLFPEAISCYHVHSVEANLVSRFVNGDALPLPPLEMLKGLGVWEEKPDCVMPIFANHLQVQQIATEIKTRFSNTPPQLPALLIRDHGVTVWAASSTAARNYIELVEYIFRYMVAARRVFGEV